MLAQADDRIIAGLDTIAVPTLVLVRADDTHFLAAADYMAAAFAENQQQGLTVAICPIGQVTARLRDNLHATSHQPALAPIGLEHIDRNVGHLAVKVLDRLKDVDEPWPPATSSSREPQP